MNGYSKEILLLDVVHLQPRMASVRLPCNKRYALVVRELMRVIKRIHHRERQDDVRRENLSMHGFIDYGCG